MENYYKQRAEYEVAREVIGINHKLNVEGLHITDLSKGKNSSHLDSDALVYKQDNIDKAFLFVKIFIILL